MLAAYHGEGIVSTGSQQNLQNKPNRSTEKGFTSPVVTQLVTSNSPKPCPEHENESETNSSHIASQQNKPDHTSESESKSSDVAQITDNIPRLKDSSHHIATTGCTASSSEAITSRDNIQSQDCFTTNPIEVDTLNPSGSDEEDGDEEAPLSLVKAVLKLQQEEPMAQVYQAEKITDSRMVLGARQYYVKWKGWSSKHNTWEPEQHIIDKKLIALYQSKGKEQ